jgi:aminoglycoside 6'-N-acetyltransferase I
MQVRLRHAVPDDASVWEKLRCALWPDGVSDHGPEIASFFAGTLDDVAAVLIAEDESGAMVGFAELSIRTDLAGLEGKRVGYVEGLYVLPEVRRRGLVRKLLQASRNWAYRQDCEAFASDRAERIIIDRSFTAKRLRSG